LSLRERVQVLPQHLRLLHKRRRLQYGDGDIPPFRSPVRRSSSTLEIPSNGAHHFESSRDNVFVDAALVGVGNGERE
jgi:hypothetical protein